MTLDVYPGSLIWIFSALDPEVKKAPDSGSGLATLSSALWNPTLSTVLRNHAFETYVGHVYIDAECLQEVQQWPGPKVRP